MADLWTRDTGIALAVTIAAVLVFTLQLILCFKAKKTAVKLVPVMALAAVAVVSYAMPYILRNWSAFIFAIIFACTLALLVFCGVAWLAFTLVRLCRKKK